MCEKLRTEPGSQEVLIKLCCSVGDYQVTSNDDFYYLRSSAAPGLILLASFSFYVWIPFVISEVTEQKCPAVKPNRVKNKPEVDTYFQNSIREKAKFSHLWRPSTLNRRVCNKLWQRDS